MQEYKLLCFCALFVATLIDKSTNSRLVFLSAPRSSLILQYENDNNNTKPKAYA